MSDPWLTIVGIGEDGHAGLPDSSREALVQAEIIFGGPRHLELAGAGDRGRPWPVPFDIDPVLAERGRKVVVLASGDPFWFGAGTSIAAHVPRGEFRTIPAPSVFSLVAAHLGWPIQRCICLGLHAAPFARMVAYLHPGAAIIATVRDGSAPAALAAWLVARGFGTTRIHVLERMGGPRQRVRTCRADAFDLTDIGAPVAVALEVAGAPGLMRGFGLADALFASDGQITKRPVRAITLSTLAPRPGELLWDIGAGSGSISVEWCLAGGRAIAVETREDRVANIVENAARFGVDDRLRVVTGRAPEAFKGLDAPDAVFIGGGASHELIADLWSVLSPCARVVVNGVTLETEALLAAEHAARGGALMRIDLAEAAPLGRMRGWVAARPVVQWSVVR
ncbi:precorrin-6y C5,15-methyltransferase (decarboxylating) subunit CbiE [Defluviimonas sp. SAOS-178_SWC]|uniref:precorrin-6y C5,15-methyltransferase (decarboxylating) subunit CbiE n=1 Tax=Defluviimonas sp. SAOS-178_SWC TaxID=3121287 RepID=UPI00322204E8